jgi:hypothetical protein
MRGRYLIAAAIALFAIALAAGCGGDDDSSASAENPKAEFVKSANAVCKKTIAEIQAGGSKIYNEFGGAGEEKEFAERVIEKILVPGFEEQIQKIRSLEIPTGDEAQVNAIFTAMRKFMRQLESHPAAEEFYPYRKAEALADRYGLTFCARPAT